MELLSDWFTFRTAGRRWRRRRRCNMGKKRKANQMQLFWRAFFTAFHATLMGSSWECEWLLPAPGVKDLQVKKRRFIPTNYSYQTIHLSIYPRRRRRRQNKNSTLKRLFIPWIMKHSNCYQISNQIFHLLLPVRSNINEFTARCNV